ncbi:poly [ADP-ribose] polymerase 2 [Nymphaea colorata]|uniref:NAD(+) ADP-ribosyltransferase n=1 Tax=Nymphaea colorata TaxID=210225 RepID=A0A5K1HHU8_9MAGN|nr:poly [ADP-ribose] polymerase 2 [Nymphaea colorata]VVW87366.1 unnamed protein product [Nymphaea colorata]
MPAKAKAKQAKVEAKKADTVSKSKDEKKKDPPKGKSAPKAPSPKKAPTPKKAPSPKKVDPPAKDPPKRKGPAVSTDDKKEDKKDAASGVKKTKSEEQIVKVITKGGAAVDALVPNKDAYRVFQNGGKIYSATLNQSNLDHNNNKFYIIQILQHEATGNIFFWSRWGRVGVPGQNALKGPFGKDIAINEYNSKYHDKAVKGDYREIEIKYDDE